MKKSGTTEDLEHASHGADGSQPDASEVAAFDLSHLDRIPKSQLRAIHLVHENFVRSLASNLSAYLRSYVGLNLVSLEQISYSEFLDGLSFPTCMAYISLAPFEGTAVLEMNMTLMFTLIELLMGSKGRSTLAVQRKITEIEKTIMHTLLKVVLRDLADAWEDVAEIGFAVQSLSSEPPLNHVMSPAEAVIVIAVDMRVGTVSGLMNLAIPSIFIKRLRHKFDPLQPVRKSQANPVDRGKVATLMQDVEVEFDASFEGGSISTRTLVDMKPGDLLVFDYLTDQPIKGSLNHRDKWTGSIATTNRGKLVFEVSDVRPENLRKA
jgi:flagellar motor switch protein FliM